MAMLRAAKAETTESKSGPSWQPWLRDLGSGLGWDEAQGLMKSSAVARLPASWDGWLFIARSRGPASGSECIMGFGRSS